MDIKVLDEIKDLYSSFDNIDNYLIKGFIWNVLSLLKSAYTNNIDIHNMCDIINKKIDINEIRTSELEWQNKANEYIKDTNFFWNENIPSVDISDDLHNSFDTLEKNNLFFIFESFLYDLDKELFLFYQEMQNENRFIKGHNNLTIHTSINNYKTLIILNEFHSLRDLLIFSHEIGHAYYIYLNKVSIMDEMDICNNIKGEIPAKIMEIEFINYLSKMMIIETSKTLQNEFLFNMHLSSLRRYNYDSLRYLIASYIAENINNDINITEYFKKIYQDNVYSLIMNVNNKENVYRKKC